MQVFRSLEEVPSELPANEVVVLQPYGSLFFAAAPTFESGLPAPTASSRNSVVILNLRGRTDLGSTFMDVLHRYAESLSAHECKLVIASTNKRLEDQLRVAGITALIGAENIYRAEARIRASIGRAHLDAMTWVDAHPPVDGTDV